MSDSSHDRLLVAVRTCDFVDYPADAPFDPGDEYPEIGSEHISAARNPVYENVRLALCDLGLDSERFGSAEWSPFRRIVQAGDKVVIKPNLVLHVPNQDAVTTHGSVVRPILDYVWKALEGSGEILVADAPQADADFGKIVDRNGLKETVDVMRARGVNVCIEDLRGLRVRTKHGVWIGEFDRDDAKSGSVLVDLGERSLFNDPSFDPRRIHGGGYERNNTVRAHSGGRHQYRVSKRVLDADVIISVPKLKTHKKAGFTCCLKNLVGINVDKNYLPHFSIGPANSGGDEFPKLDQWRVPLVRCVRFCHDLILGRFWRQTGRAAALMLGIFGKVRTSIDRKSPTGSVRPAYKFYYLLTGKYNYQGSWQGNETIWRMILDLNRIMLYANGDGTLRETPQRKHVCIVDGFISGVRNGPMDPCVIRPGIVAAGFNALMVDMALLLLAGIRPECIPLFREAARSEHGWLNYGARPAIVLNGKEIGHSTTPRVFELKPPDNWDFEEIEAK